jgi:hypothetical protein
VDGFFPERFEAGADLRGRRRAHADTGADDEVGGGQAGLGKPERVADYATKSVAGDGISDGFCGQRHAEAGVAEAVRAQHEAEEGVAETPTLAEGGVEIGFAQDSPGGREGETRRRGHGGLTG